MAGGLVDTMVVRCHVQKVAASALTLSRLDDILCVRVSSALFATQQDVMLVLT